MELVFFSAIKILAQVHTTQLTKTQKCYRCFISPFSNHNLDVCNGRTRPPPLNAIGQAMVPNYLLIVEIVSAYVTIAASNRVKHMTLCNGKLGIYN